MKVLERQLIGTMSVLALLVCAPGAWAQSAQGESPWVIDFGIGVDTSVNGNVNAGAIGILEGQAAAILPNPYGDVYGTGLQLRFGGGYLLNEESELRAVFTWQSADADLVRLGDIGASSLYAEYSDYQSLALDVGYRRYVPIPDQNFRVYGEATIGLAFIDAIDALMAAPQAGIRLRCHRLLRSDSGVHDGHQRRDPLSDCGAARPQRAGRTAACQRAVRSRSAGGHGPGAHQ